jgi:hypothetical protein
VYLDQGSRPKARLPKVSRESYATALQFGAPLERDSFAPAAADRMGDLVGSNVVLAKFVTESTTLMMQCFGSEAGWLMLATLLSLIDVLETQMEEDSKRRI